MARGPGRNDGSARRRRRAMGWRAIAGACLLAVVATACGTTDSATPVTPAGGSTTSVSSAGTAPGGSGASVGGPALASFADYKSVNYDEPSHWVCRPEVQDICKSDLDTTIVEADGSMTVEAFEAADDPAIDCFYVYPTISRDQTTNSDWTADADEEGYVTLNQAARLRSVCRVFAPVYRQFTLKSLISRVGGGATPEGEPAIDPYADVLDAFRTYMARDNGGRGIVLVGHSQGAGLLTKLIAEEFDEKPEVRALLVAAYLAGTSVAVPEGADMGGAFDNVPLCRRADQTGCAMAWASFRATAPPTATSFFGKNRGADGVAACVNAAAPGGGPAELHAYFPVNRTASIVVSQGISDTDQRWVAASSGTIATPFVSVPGLLTGECVAADGANYLSVMVDGRPEDPRADDIGGDLTPDWGLHLVDMNLVMGDIIDDVRRQAAAFG